MLNLIKKLANTKSLNQSWQLKDVEITAKNQPKEFFIPSQQERENQKLGELVQLHFVIKNPQKNEPQAERMWVEIESKENSKYTGILTNSPAHIKDLKVGDTIVFEAKNIAQTIIKKDNPLWVDSIDKYAFVSKLCLNPNEVIRYIYREQPANEVTDSGFRVFAGKESDEYVNNPANIELVSIHRLLDQDPTLIIPFKGAIGDSFERKSLEEEWYKIED